MYSSPWCDEWLARGTSALKGNRLDCTNRLNHNQIDAHGRNHAVTNLLLEGQKFLLEDVKN